MSDATAMESKPTAKMKTPLLFENETDEYCTIVTQENFWTVWKQLEIWVRAMIVECPEERHDPWYRKWVGYKKFHFDDPKTSMALVTVCIMENMENEYNVLHLLESLTSQIPFLPNHIYYTSGDVNDTTAVLKLKMFQSYDFQNPYYKTTFSDSANQFNTFAAIPEETEDEGRESTSNMKDPPSQGDKNTVQENNNVDVSDVVNDGSMMLSEAIDLEVTDESLLSYSNETNQDDGRDSAVSLRNKRKKETLKHMIKETCKQELQAIQETLVSELQKELAKHMPAHIRHVVDPTLPTPSTNSNAPGDNANENNGNIAPSNGNNANENNGNLASTEQQNPTNAMPSTDATPQVTNTSTFHHSSSPFRSPTPAGFGRGASQRHNQSRWNSAWRHKNNPNYQQIPVQNPYRTVSSTTSRGNNVPPSHVQFSNSTPQGVNSTSSMAATPPNHNHSTVSGNQPLYGMTGIQQTGQSTSVGGPNIPAQQPPTPQYQPAYNRPTPHPPVYHQQQQHHLIKGGSIQFIHQNQTYELRDTDFTKYAGDLLPVHNTEDIIHFYKHIQSMAIQRNIFVTEFEKLQYWDRSNQPLPPTCVFTTVSVADNTELAYKRMRSVLYQKIRLATFSRQEDKEIVRNHAVSQDGFSVLYDLSAKCHPHLIAKMSRYNRYNSRPQMTSEDNIYTLKRKYDTWLEIERVDHHVYTDECILRYIMQDLREDTRYDRALHQLEIDLATFDTMKKHSTAYIPFPSDLLLHNLPQTVMSCYSDAEKDSLFSNSSISKLHDTTSITSSDESSMEEGFVRTVFSSGDAQDIQAFINVMKRSPRLPARDSVDKLCKGCGKFGHDIYHQGCDFCAQLAIALKFLEKHPNEIKEIISKYMSYQRERQQLKRDKTVNFKKMKSPMQRNKFKATVKSISAAVESALQEFVTDDTSSQGDDEFEDAQDIGDNNDT